MQSNVVATNAADPLKCDPCDERVEAFISFNFNSFGFEERHGLVVTTLDRCLQHLWEASVSRERNESGGRKQMWESKLKGNKGKEGAE